MSIVGFDLTREELYPLIKVPQPMVTTISMGHPAIVDEEGVELRPIIPAVTETIELNFFADAEDSL
jgi:hypothetical protein